MTMYVANSPRSPVMETELNLFDWYNGLEAKIQKVIIQTARGCDENFQNLMGLMLKGKSYDNLQIPVFKTFIASIAAVPKDVTTKLAIPGKSTRARSNITVPERKTPQARITRSVGSSGSFRNRNTTTARSPTVASSKLEKPSTIRSKSTNSAGSNKSTPRIQKAATYKGESLLQGTKITRNASTPRHIAKTSSNSSTSSNLSARSASPVCSPLSPSTPTNGSKNGYDMASREKWRPPSWYKEKLVDDANFLEEKEAYRGELNWKEAEYREPVYNGDGTRFDPLPNRGRYKGKSTASPSKPRTEKIRSKSSANLKVVVKAAPSDSCTLPIGSEEGEEGAENWNNNDGEQEIQIRLNGANLNERQSNSTDEGNKTNEQEQEKQQEEQREEQREQEKENVVLDIQVNEPITPGDNINITVHNDADKNNDINDANEHNNDENDNNDKNEDKSDENNDKNNDDSNNNDDNSAQTNDNSDKSETNETETVNTDGNVQQENNETNNIVENNNVVETIKESDNKKKKDATSWIKYHTSSSSTPNYHKPRSQSVEVQKLDISQFQHLTKISVSLTNSQRVVLDKRDLDLVYRRSQRSASSVEPILEKEKIDSSNFGKIEERLD